MNISQKNQGGIQTFPYAPPLDSQVRFEPIGVWFDSTKPGPNSIRFCAICDLPILVKIVVYPCRHFMCFSCFSINPNECKRCEDIISEFKRIPENENFYACEFEECKRYFESEEFFQHHSKIHNN